MNILNTYDISFLRHFALHAIVIKNMENYETLGQDL